MIAIDDKNHKLYPTAAAAAAVPSRVLYICKQESSAQSFFHTKTLDKCSGHKRAIKICTFLPCVL